MVYVPIIIGSPRKSGNTTILAREAGRGLAESNIAVEEFHLNELVFSGCQACYACKQEDNITCVRNDDMQRMYDALDKADGVILASPIYFGGVTGQTKNWLDRLFPYISMDLGSHLHDRIPISCIYTQNQPDATLFTGSMDSLEFALNLIGFTIRDRLIAPDLDAAFKPMATEKKDLMKQAYQIGTNLIK
jgi:multimeric flavodoxin WrbA